MSSKLTDAVFLNVLFDEEYRPLFQALIFTIWDCGSTRLVGRWLEQNEQ